MDENLQAFLSQTDEISKSYVKDILEGYKTHHTKEVSHDELSAITFTVGYMASRLGGTIFIQYIFPLIKRNKRIFWILIISIILLLLALLAVWFSLNINSFVIFLTLCLPAILGISLSSLKGLKIWSEAKRNLAEVKRIEQETH